MCSALCVVLQTEVQSLRARLGGNMPGGSVGVSATNIDDIIAAAATAAATGGVNAAGNSNKGGGISGGSLTVEADTLAWIDALAQVGLLKGLTSKTFASEWHQLTPSTSNIDCL